MVNLFNRKKTTPVALQNEKVTIEDILSQQKENPYRFNLFNDDAINNNLLLYGNSNGSSSKFFNKLIQQEYKQYPDLTSVVFTTSLEYYKELIDSNISTVIYSLSDFTLNPFDTFEECIGNDNDNRNHAYSQAEHQVGSLIKDVIKESGYEKYWSQQHSFILSYQIQELIRNANKIPTMNELYTKMYNEFLEKGNYLTETFKSIQTLDALNSEIIEALDPLTEEKNEVHMHFETLKKYQIYQDILVVLSKFIRLDSYSKFFKAETKIPIMDDKKVVIIEVPKNYEKSHTAAIAFLTEFLSQSNAYLDGLRAKGKMAIYHDIQCTSHSSLLIRTLRRCRRHGVGIRINAIYKLSHDLMSNFSKYAFVQSEHFRKHHIIESFQLSEEECENILTLKDGECYVMRKS